MTSSKAFHHLTSHSLAAIIASIISSVWFADTLCKTSCLMAFHVLIFWKLQPNDPVPNWLGSWDSWFGRVYVNLLFVTLSHITTWLVLDRVKEVVLKQMAGVVEEGRSLMSWLVLIECIIMVIITVLVFRPSQKVFGSSFLIILNVSG